MAKPRAKYYTDQAFVMRSLPQGWIMCRCDHHPAFAKDITAALNGTKAKRIIRALLKTIKPGSKQEERSLVAILKAEKFLREGPA